MKWLHTLLRLLSSNKPASQTRFRSCLGLEALEDRYAPAVFTVTNVNDSGPGSLRSAILKANATVDADSVLFNIPAASIKTIALQSALPNITQPLVIDGLTQPGSAGRPVVELTGTGAGAQVNGLTLAAATSGVRGLVINGFNGHGVVVQSDACFVSTCFIGTNGAGAAAVSNSFNGVLVTSASNRIVNNLISGNNDSGVELRGLNARSNRIKGNRIGTDALGSLPLKNGKNGVLIAEGANRNLVGGTTATARNLLSGNDDAGVSITGVGSNSNVVAGNFIGLAGSGSVGIGNQFGVQIVAGASNNIIGGLTPGSRNVISGTANGKGVQISDLGTTRNKVQGNFIGTDFTGNSALGQSFGVTLESGASNNLIGGTAPEARNVIAGNAFGVFVVNEFTSDNKIQGNFIGTNAAGSLALGNTTQGIDIEGARNTLVGGTTPGAGNLISGNGNGVIVVGSTNTVIQGNRIGTNVAGTSALGNAQVGINSIDNVALQIGGASTAARNVISGNTGTGIALARTNGAQIQGNFIGLAADGLTPLGNGGFGVALLDESSNNLIGGTTPGTGNAIAHNSRSGVLIGSDPGGLGAAAAGEGNAILGNSIFNNVQLGIDLGVANSVTNNDSNDVDFGPNELQNFPVLTTAVVQAGALTITNSLNSGAGRYLIEFFVSPSADAIGFGEGKTFLGATSVLLVGNLAIFTVTIPALGVVPGQVITATATDAEGNTSEFSLARVVT